MGINIGDTLQLINGLTAKNTYGCIENNSINIFKKIVTGGNNNNSYTVKFVLQAVGSIWANKGIRNSNGSIIKNTNIKIEYENDTFLNQNVYGLLYAKWKEDYTTVTDDI